METNLIKKFAVEARDILKSGVFNKISSLGFDEDGKVCEIYTPKRFQGGAVFMEAIVENDTFYDKWMSLYHNIQRKGIKEVCEEVSYTWFNRFMAIRIMQKNKFISPLLEYESEAVHIPRIVTDARHGILPNMTEDDRNELLKYMEDDNKVTEQFTYLIVSFCQSNPILKTCFGGINDCTELLLPKNILAEGGFIDLLNHTYFISDDDFHQSELIGWLYQFYISERKDEVFASFKNNHKAEADDIPAATQIFTPNWIVKYMVQNTIGRIYLDNNPNSDLRKSMNYLVNNESDEVSTKDFLRVSNISELRIIDPACGSGHILLEAFDLLLAMYREEGYSRRQAIESIFKNNIVGIDIDTRAKQLATFAMLMKACQYDNSFLDAHILPHVMDMPATYESEELNAVLPNFFAERNQKFINETIKAIKLFDKADNLGSIMKFDISNDTRTAIAIQLSGWQSQDIIPGSISTLLPYFDLIIALTDKYSAVVANPPYMGSGNMNTKLSKYVQDNYPNGKADLFAVFMSVGMHLLIPNGKMGMINMQSWMFLSSFEKLRRYFLDNYQIDNMLHLGPHTFDELNGEVVQNTTFVISKEQSLSAGIYYRLIEGNNCKNKEEMFLQRHGRYDNISQKRFEKIPGCPIAYWLSNTCLSAFDGKLINDYASPRQGCATGDNCRFLRLWFEIAYSRMGLNYKCWEDAVKSGYKWFPTTKGGGFRRWYGNKEYVLAFDKENYEALSSMGNHLPSKNFYFHVGASWSTIASGKISFRHTKYSIFEAKGSICFPKVNINYNYLFAYLNSVVCQKFLEVISPTLDYHEGPLRVIPLKYDSNYDLDKIVMQNISICKEDWDSHEISFDFQKNELVRIKDFGGYPTAEIEGESVDIGTHIEDLYIFYCEHWKGLFMQLHDNEKELNRQFIEIYGLQDELTPDVPLDEITILQKGEISIKDNDIAFNSDIVIKQLISYAVGCMIGRYRIDKPGLHIAYPNPSDEDIAPYTYNGEQFIIDDDAIIPLMPRDSAFSDNVLNKFTDFIRIVFGKEALTGNLNFIEESIGKSIEEYFIKDFWKDHKKMYHNCPIYWLFRSSKGAFQVITYMHRMDAYTVEKIRNKYLLPHIEYLGNRITEYENHGATLTATEHKRLDKMRKDLIECNEYHDRLHIIADAQIAFDLDDGVVVNYAKFGDVVAKIK